MPSTMSAPVEASTTTSGMLSSRAVRAAVSTTDEVADDSGTPRKPEAVRPPCSTHTTDRSPIVLTSAVTASSTRRCRPSVIVTVLTLRGPPILTKLPQHAHGHGEQEHREQDVGEVVAHAVGERPADGRGDDP